MHVGIDTPCTQETLGPADLAREVEERGFESLFLWDHTHMPVASKYPAVYGDEMPAYYKRTYDLFVSLSVAAAVTTDLKVGAGVCLVPERDPITTAKAVATLDVVSGGRLAAFGVGFGWNRAELDAYGVEFTSRRELVRDRVALMRTLWTEDIASYEGQHARLAPSWSWPKPTGVPRIYLGASGPKAMRHAAEWADAWFPPVVHDYPTMEKRIQEFWQVVDDVGRDPATIGIAFCSVPGHPEILDGLRGRGAERVTLLLEPDAPDRQLHELDRLATLISRLA